MSGHGAIQGPVTQPLTQNHLFEEAPREHMSTDQIETSTIL